MTEKIVNGFLGSEYIEHSKHIRSKFIALFELSEDLNRFGYEILNSLKYKIHNKLQEIVTFILYC